MPWYSYHCPLCHVERSDVFKMDEAAPVCENSDAHEEPVEMVKDLAAPGFHVTGGGAYSQKVY